MSDTLNESSTPPEICPSCGATVTGQTVCSNCGTDIRPKNDPMELKPIDQLLLERLEKDPPIEGKQAPFTTIVGIALAIMAVAFGMWLLTKKPEVFAEGPPADAAHQHSEGDGHDHGMSATDSAEMAAQMAILNSTIDSLEHVVKSSSDDSAQIHLAALYSLKGDYESSKKSYEAYIAKYPKDADVRTDYASVVSQLTNDPKVGLKQLELALQSDPENFRALYNAAYLSLQIKTEHDNGFVNAKKYLERAKAVKMKDDPETAEKLDQAIKMIDEKQASIKAKKDSTAKAGKKPYPAGK